MKYAKPNSVKLQLLRRELKKKKKKGAPTNLFSVSKMFEVKTVWYKNLGRSNIGKSGPPLAYAVFECVRYASPNAVATINTGISSPPLYLHVYHFPWDRSHNGGTGPSDNGTGPSEAILEN